MKNALRNHQKGFTLIEILIVVGILAVLMGIVLVAINTSMHYQSSNSTNYMQQ